MLSRGRRRHDRLLVGLQTLLLAGPRLCGATDLVTLEAPEDVAAISPPEAPEAVLDSGEDLPTTDLSVEKVVGRLPSERPNSGRDFFRSLWRSASARSRPEEAATEEADDASVEAGRVTEPAPAQATVSKATNETQTGATAAVPASGSGGGVLLRYLDAIEATRELMKRMPFDLDGASCPEDGTGERIGCTAHCQCGWGRRCYPRYALVDEWGVANTARINVGVCDVDMWLPIASSISFFLIFLGGLIVVRIQFPLNKTDPHKVGDWGDLLNFMQGRGRPFSRPASSAQCERPERTAAGVAMASAGRFPVQTAAASSTARAAPVRWPSDDIVAPYVAAPNSSLLALALGSAHGRTAAASRGQSFDIFDERRRTDSLPSSG